MSIVEVIIAIVLLAIFGTATTVIVIQGGRVSADNAARIVATGLADRELTLSGEVVTGSPGGADLLLNPATVVNPNVTPEMSSHNAEYAFRSQGQLYRVERHANLQPIGAGTPCENISAAEVKQFAVLVTVTVTWMDMGRSTSPHVASRLFAPHRDAVAGLDPGEAVLGVRVTGTKGTGPGTPPYGRQNVEVEVTGGGFFSNIQVTDERGCAIFVITPPAGGANYQVTLLGYLGNGDFVNSAHEIQPTRTEYMLFPGESRPVPFADYEPAASFTAKILNWDDSLIGTIDTVSLLPADPAAATITRPIVVSPGSDPTATFEAVWPGAYTVQIGGVLTNIAFGLDAGDHQEKDVPVP
ncbi:MAG: hypothetical protein LBJ08_05980 [Bifidobacteriaceae bacterium]|nr:hypothetical protein [Bifidobacteriaceae bacterium]